MAITIQHNPGTYFSVNGDVLFTVCDIVKASDPVTYPDYRYVADVYIGSTFVTRLKAYPQPDNKMGVFNIGNILRAYIAANFNPTPLVFRSQEMGLAEWNIVATVKFGEEYNFTLYTNITVDSARTYYGHYNGRLVGQTTNLAAYVRKPMTTRAYQNYVSRDAKFCFVPYLPTTTGAFENNISITAYRYNDTPINTTYNMIPTAANILQQLNISPAVINAWVPGLITEFVSHYIFSVNTVDAPPFPEYRFDLVCEPRYEIFTIHFLNKFGGFESREFTKVSRKTIDIEKSEFGKFGYVMDTSGVITYSNSNNVYNETKAVYSSQFKEKLVLNTDILSDDEYTWLGELILSPMVFVEQVASGVTYFLPCAITANNYEFRKAINDKLTNLTIDIEFGEQFNAQYR